MVVKTTRWSPDTCACQLEYTWDSTDSETSRTHTFLNYINRCPAHPSLSTDTQRYNAVSEENLRKNDSFGIALNNGPAILFDTQVDGTRSLKNGITFSWTWSGTAPNRLLTITYTGISLTTNQRNAIQTKLDNKFGIGKVVIA